MTRCVCGKTECIECDGYCPYCGETSEVRVCEMEDKSRKLAELLGG